jgi:outer membrane protein OmpA-like peptidoglycan-associated protein
MSVLWWLFATAHAQEQGVIDFALDVERYHPHTDTYGYAVTESSTTLGHLQVGVGFFGQASFDSLVLLGPDGERIIGPGPNFPDGMLDLRSTVDLQFGFGLGNRFALLVDVPAVVWQSGFEPAAFGSPSAVNDIVSSGVGDVRIAPKLTILDIDEDVSPVGVAIMNTVTVPSGSTRSFIGEGGLTAIPMAIIEGADGSVHDGDYQVRAAINAGARIKEPDAFRDLNFGTEFLWRGAIGAKPHDIIEVGADIHGAVGGNRVALAPVEVMPWVKFMGSYATIGGGVGVGLNPGVGAPDLRAFGGATLAPSFDPLSLDRDKDGIPNKFDLCINIPEDHDGFEDQDGCPEDDNDRDGILDINDACPNDPEDFDGFEDQDGCPDLDNDRDGIYDVQDACPMVPEDADGFQDFDGCPDPDNDGDGILDLADACPMIAETFNGFQDQDGCPDEKPFIDTDGDGYADEVDRCPLDPEDFDGWQDEDGCPELDNDNDGILDVVDQCPFDPETVNGYLDEDGCPDTAPSRVVVEKQRIVITETIFFEYNKAIIQAMSFELLDEVVKAIQDHPHITLIQVEGHTDADGSDTYNLKLSQRRAEAVVEYLVRGGVDPSRLVAKGFGESVPIDTNETTEGKARNRRVAFTILDKSND